MTLPEGRTAEVERQPDRITVTLRYLMTAKCALVRGSDGAWSLPSAREAHNACYVLYGDDNESRRAALAGVLQRLTGHAVKLPHGPPYIFVPVGFRFQPVFASWEDPGGGSQKRPKIHPGAPQR